MKIFDICDYGAVGDGQALNTQAVQNAANACRDAGGGVVRIPGGQFVTGIFELFSNTTLLVQKGGRLIASPRLEDHWVDGASVGLLYVRDAQNVVLTGEGVLDGNGRIFFDENTLNDNNAYAVCDTWQKRRGLPYGTKETIHGPWGWNERPGNMVVFARCHNVRIERLTVTGAAYWTIHCADCEDVIVENLRIDNDLRFPNNDGIHFTTCRRVVVRNCHFACGDDCIAVTGFREAMGEKQIAFGLSGIAGVCEDIEVSDCVLVSHSAGVRIGYGHNPVRNVRLRRLDIHESNRGIGIFARQADAEDILVEDCRIQTQLFHGHWWGRGEPIHLSAVRYSGDSGLFHIRRVTFRNIEATGENAVTLFAEKPGFIDDVKMINVRSTLKRGELFDAWGGNLDLRPFADEARSIMAGGTAPLWAIGVTHLQCENCQWTLADTNGATFTSQIVIQENP